MAVRPEATPCVAALTNDLTCLDLVARFHGLRTHVAVHRGRPTTVLDGYVNACPSSSVVGYDGPVLYSIEGCTGAASEVLSRMVACPGAGGAPWRP